MSRKLILLIAILVLIIIIAILIYKGLSSVAVGAGIIGGLIGSGQSMQERYPDDFDPKSYLDVSDEPDDVVLGGSSTDMNIYKTMLPHADECGSEHIVEYINKTYDLESSKDFYIPDEVHYPELYQAVARLTSSLDITSVDDFYVKTGISFVHFCRDDLKQFLVKAPMYYSPVADESRKMIEEYGLVNIHKSTPEISREIAAFNKIVHKYKFVKGRAKLTAAAISKLISEKKNMFEVDWPPTLALLREYANRKMNQGDVYTTRQILEDLVAAGYSYLVQYDKPLDSIASVARDLRLKRARDLSSYYDRLLTRRPTTINITAPRSPPPVRESRPPVRPPPETRDDEADAIRLALAGVDPETLAQLRAAGLSDAEIAKALQEAIIQGGNDSTISPEEIDHIILHARGVCSKCYPSEEQIKKRLSSI